MQKGETCVFIYLVMYVHYGIRTAMYINIKSVGYLLPDRRQRQRGWEETGVRHSYLTLVASLPEIMALNKMEAAMCLDLDLQLGR